jgi:hypothetical protein
MAEFISTMKLEVIDPDTGAVTGSREIDLRNGIILSAAPTSSMPGRVGMSAYVTSGGAITAEYVCTGASGGVYTWVKKSTASGGGEDSIFMAEYETTPYDEIRAAHNTGKVVILRRGNLQYVLAAAKPGSVIFSNVTGVTVSKITVSSDDVWSESSSTINTGSGGGEDSIFIAVYNSTQYSEIREAYDAGKIVFVQYNNSICNLYRVAEDRFGFIRNLNAVNMFIYAQQAEEGRTAWYVQETDLQTVANMTTTISDTPSNDTYPSEKAVYDFVKSLLPS